MFRLLATAVVGILVALVVSAFAWQAWDHAHTFYPAPENESAFFKAYKLKAIVDKYEYPESSSYGEGESAGAGKTMVTHGRQFDYYIPICNESRVALISAMGHYTEGELGRDGAHIISQSGNAAKGFKYEYSTGKSAGSISIAPLEQAPAPTRIAPFPAGVGFVRLKVSVDERWFPRSKAHRTRTM